MQSSSCISVPLRTSPGLPIALQRKLSLRISCRPITFTSPCREGRLPRACCSPAGILLFVLPTCSERIALLSLSEHCVVCRVCVSVCVVCVRVCIQGPS